MKKTICTLIALLVVFLPLTGCLEQAGSRGAMGSEIWETMPQLTYGEMEYEKLQVLPWNCGRCESTSFSTMAETEKGYYTFFDIPVLQYADKANLNFWIPVCAKPVCRHTDSYCPARLASNSFVTRNDRIYYPHHKNQHIRCL